MKFKTGDLVEIHGLINVPEHNGIRFVIEGVKRGDFQNITGEILEDVVRYEAPIKSWAGGDKSYFAAKNLRKVNPDGDELSSYSFEGLIESIKNTESV